MSITARTTLGSGKNPLQLQKVMNNERVGRFSLYAAAFKKQGNQYLLIKNNKSTSSASTKRALCVFSYKLTVSSLEIKST
jgi:hypothetical protein